MMKIALLAALIALSARAYPDRPDVSIPAVWIERIKATDFVEVSGTNDLGGAEDFTIHNSAAIAKFIDFLTSDRYTAVAKDLKPDFKSRSIYNLRLSARGQLVLEFRIIGDSVLDLPDAPSFYMESDRHSDNLLAPLLRLR